MSKLRQPPQQPDRQLFETILGRPPERVRIDGGGWRILTLAWIFALGAHLALVLIASRAEPSLETWSARMATLIHLQLSSEAQVFVEPPPPTPEPPPPTPEPPPPTPEPATPVPQPKTVTVPPREPSPPASPPVIEDAPPPVDTQPAPPAAAGEIIDAEVDPAAPVDFTGDTFISGNAAAFVGGVSASAGTNPVPVYSGEVDPNAEPNLRPGQESLARSVGLAPGAWRCRWPAQAVAQDVYEQFVVLRVVVRADGSAKDVMVVDDPGHGFAEAAIACAKRTRFLPAQNSAGRAIQKRSPPIRVRFTR